MTHTPAAERRNEESDVETRCPRILNIVKSEGKPKSSFSSYSALTSKALAIAVVGIAARATFRNGGAFETEERRCSILKDFLEETREQARGVGRYDDASNACQDPSRWLNSAGQDLLSDLPGFRHYNRSMLWGTYRPGIFFGLKSRTSPEHVTAGLMWHGGDETTRVRDIRHECSSSDGVGPYGWKAHDGVRYGRQEIVDKKLGIRLITSVVKPKLLTPEIADLGAGSDEVELATRIEVQPLRDGGASAADLPLRSTVYLYVGVDCTLSEQDEGTLCSGDDRQAGGLEAAAGVTSQASVRIAGQSLAVGKFEMVISAFSAPESPMGVPVEEAGELSISFSGTAKQPVLEVQDILEKMLHTHQRSVRKARVKAPETLDSQPPPFTLPNKIEESSNLVLVKVSGQGRYSVDMVLRTKDPSHTQETKGTHLRIEEEKSMSDWFEAGSRSFAERFENTFGLRGKGFGDEEVEAAQSALSNMLGGMGFFDGRSEVKGAGANNRNAFSFQATLFTAVPSRSFFPRGFLWDEGFHQLLVIAWSKTTTVDVLGHWLSLMHVHDSFPQPGRHCSGAWMPREQILGAEARRRVPNEFIAQGVDVANPPTFLLLIDRLLDSLKITRGGESNHDNMCYASETDTAGPRPRTGHHSQGDDSYLVDDETVFHFLGRAFSILDQWMRWLIITQRSGAEKWGEQDGEAPLGAFQWRSRDLDDDRLNPLTLASGLDDYPRASHPSDVEERHVDLLCWLAMGCGVMDRLAKALDAKSLPYGELRDELLSALFHLHWDKEEEAFFDVGRHVSEGQVVDEAVLRCMRGDGDTVDVGVPVAAIKDRTATCPPNSRPMFPLGDGRGGLLVRRRWRGGTPQPQYVQHVGYVSIFPLLLKLLPPENAAVGSLLAQIRDSSHLWSPHGLRSLSASDPLYQVENNPGDDPYWRGHIWVNINYLALGALSYYGTADGPFRKDSKRIYDELRSNLLRTLLGGFRATGFFWEQYDDRTGNGLRSYPFTGWTALVVMIMAEMY